MTEPDGRGTPDVDDGAEREPDARGARNSAIPGGNHPAGPERTDPTGPDGDGPVEPGGRAALVRALHVRRNAKWGFALALAVTLAVFVFFVAVPGTTRPALLYVALAFVLAVSLGGLLTALLTLVSAVRLARET